MSITRNVVEDEYRDYKITVTTSLTIEGENWPVNVFITRTGREAVSIDITEPARTMMEALNIGFTAGQRAIDEEWTGKGH